MPASSRSILQDKIDDIDPTENAVEDRPGNGVPGGIADHNCQSAAEADSGFCGLIHNAVSFSSISLFPLKRFAFHGAEIYFFQIDPLEVRLRGQ